MEIRIAEKSGFCFGVKRAVDIAIEETKKESRSYSYGQLIHNHQVTDRLKEGGLIEVSTLDEVESSIIIRSHGVGKDFYVAANDKGLEIVDCTCPYVKKVHKIVDTFYKKGYEIIIIGNSEHPEIIGINGWCQQSALIIEDHVPHLKPGKYCVVAQTTLKQETFDTLVKEILDQTDAEVHNTICSATEERQKAAIALAKEVDCMIVIGGLHSSNTKKLYELCKELCNNTRHIEKKEDLVMTNLNKCGIIGITAGASTPSWVIDEVYQYLERMDTVSKK